jgi:hypothetical protein
MSESRTELTKEAQTALDVSVRDHAARSSYRARQRVFAVREFLASGESEGAPPLTSDERVSD